MQEIERHRGYRPKASVILLYNRVLPPRAGGRYWNDPTATRLRECAAGTVDPAFGGQGNGPVQWSSVNGKSERARLKAASAKPQSGAWFKFRRFARDRSATGFASAGQLKPVGSASRSAIGRGHSVVPFAVNFVQTARIPRCFLFESQLEQATAAVLATYSPIGHAACIDLGMMMTGAGRTWHGRSVVSLAE